MINIRPGRARRWASAFLLLAGCSPDGRMQRPREPTMVPGVSIGMTRSALLDVRPAATDDSDILSERIGPGETMIYWFGRNFHQTQIPRDRLAVVVHSARPAESERVNLMDVIRGVEQRWTTQLGLPDTIPARELTRGRHTRVWLHGRIWNTPGQYVILTFERAANPPSPDHAVAYTVVIQDIRLDPEVSLPDR